MRQIAASKSFLLESGEIRYAFAIFAQSAQNICTVIENNQLDLKNALHYTSNCIIFNLKY